MRRLVPGPQADIDPFEAYDDQPGTWLRLGMVTSVDGSATDERGRSGGLGGAPDRQVFATLRALADAILVGAGTAASEGYGPHRPTAALRERRVATGRPPFAPIVVVTRSMRLDWTRDLFTAAPAPTIVLTCTDAAAGANPPAGVRLVVAGGAEVDLAEGIRQLRIHHGLDRLLCEGGPTLATRLLASGLVDELCLTLAPSLLGTRYHTPLVRDLEHRVEFTLTALYEDRGVLLSRFRPAR